MLLTDAQLYEIRQIIEDHHHAFIVSAVGPEAVSPEILERLEKLGFVDEQINSIEDAYLYGQVLAALNDSKAASMTYEQFKAHLQKHPIPLSPVEQRAVQWAQHSCAQYVVGLGNTVSKDTGQLLIEADAQLRQETKKAIREKTSTTIAERRTAQELRSDLGWMAKDWARNWDRIAITEMQDAFQNGEADYIEEEAGEDALAFKRAMPDACKHCRRLHIGPDGAPRIFKLSELRANGTNFRVKASEWKATIGPVHPHCQCLLQHLPPGWGFNEDGEMWPGGEYGVKYSSEADVQKAILEEDTLQKSIGDGRAFFQGLEIFIESPAGSTRKWAGGETKMLLPYGYIKRAGGLDEDELDVYLGPDPRAENAYIVVQTDPQTGTVDEHKVFLGLSNEKLAREYFLAHRDDGDDALFDITPVPMDQFKRWIDNTEAPSLPLFKSSTARPQALVIPFEKALTGGRVRPESVDPGQAGDRGQGPGVGYNWYVDTQAKEMQPPGDDVTEAFQSWFAQYPEEEERAREAMSRDREAYYVAESLPRRVHDMSEAIEAQRELFVIPEDHAKRERDALELYTAKRYKNNANTVRPDMEKSFGGAPQAGHKYTARYWMNGHWVYEYATKRGGKVSGHHTDLDKVVVKIPLNLADDLQAFKKEHNISGKIVLGGHYAMIEVHKDEADKMRAAVKQLKKEAKAELAPAVTGPTERQGNMELADPKTLKRPKVHEHYMTRGTQVYIDIGGTSVKTELRGINVHGDPVVFHGGKRHVLQWGAVKPAGARLQRASFDGLPKGAILKADVRQRKLVAGAIDTKVVGDHTAREYADWLWKRGEETYLVGGIVRDLISGTAPGSTKSDAVIQEEMQDVDYVSTASVAKYKQMLKGVSGELDNGGLWTDGGQAWGVIKAGGSNALDLACMHAHGTMNPKEKIPDSEKPAPPSVFDHEIGEDFKRRDFTCNTLYYDVNNDTIIDPTGQGIADAQARVLRLADEKYLTRNETLWVRFWKFRARGYKPEAKTREQMLAQAEKVLSQWPAHDVRKELSKFVKGKGGDPLANLHKFRDAMISDGAGHLYAKYIKPLEHKFKAK